MKIVFNALSARLGGGQTYLINLFQFVPDNADLEILVFAPASLKLPGHPRIKRVEPAWPTENPIVRAMWERWVLPGILKAEKADVLFCPGGVVGTSAPAGCKVATMFRNMIPFDLRVRKSIPLGLQRLRNWLLNRVMLKSMREADLTIFISNYARSVIESLTNIKNPVTIPHGIGSVFRTHGDSNVLRPDFCPLVTMFCMCQDLMCTSIIMKWLVLMQSCQMNFVKSFHWFCRRDESCRRPSGSSLS